MKVQGKEGMAKEAARFVRALAPHKGGATVVALSGELGAGKTAFVKGVAHALGIDEHITSPTFVIMKIYDLLDQPFKRLIHMDAYRLKGAKHLAVLGWDELVKDRENLIMVEWPEKISGALPRSALEISFSYSGEDEREIDYTIPQATGSH